MSIGDHPHTDPGDGRTECDRCGKFVFPAIHSCKRVPVTAAAKARAGMSTPPDGSEPVAENRVLAALHALGWRDDRADRHRPGLLYGWAEDAIRAVDATDRQQVEARQ